MVNANRSGALQRRSIGIIAEPAAKGGRCRPGGEAMPRNWIEPERGDGDKADRLAAPKPATVRKGGAR